MVCLTDYVCDGHHYWICLLLSRFKRAAHMHGMTSSKYPRISEGKNILSMNYYLVSCVVCVFFFFYWYVFMHYYYTYSSYLLAFSQCTAIIYIWSNSILSQSVKQKENDYDSVVFIHNVIIINLSFHLIFFVLFTFRLLVAFLSAIKILKENEFKSEQSQIELPG